MALEADFTREKLDRLMNESGHKVSDICPSNFCSYKFLCT